GGDSRNALFQRLLVNINGGMVGDGKEGLCWGIEL
ncbi:unnamed protein product, partial [Rotaria socialis]